MRVASFKSRCSRYSIQAVLLPVIKGARVWIGRLSDSIRLFHGTPTHSQGQGLVEPQHTVSQASHRIVVVLLRMRVAALSKRPPSRLPSSKKKKKSVSTGLEFVDGVSRGRRRLEC